MSRNRFLLVVALVLFPLLSARADDADAAAQASFQTRMRETLRNTMQQLSDAQNQLATAQAAQAQSDKDKTDLQAKLDVANGQLKSLAEQSAADKDAATKSIAALNDQVAEANKQITALNDALAQWKVAYSQSALLAKNTEDARAKLAGEKLLLERLVDDRELKNAELYNTGVEILDRYEKFSIGDAISAKEPFIGITRVRLSELVQDYKDKLLDQRISPGQPVSTPPPPTAAADQPAPAKKSERPQVRTAQNGPPALEKATP
jgi:DNA repair exonuclease SbcCD ATPase subunit